MLNAVFQNCQGWVLKSSDKKQITGVKIKTEKKFGLKEGHFIVCRNCGNTITTPERMISVNEQHIHTFTNPAGITYDIGCFSSASGCIVYGQPTLEHTWFEGFSWSLSLCSHCLVHLGWYYQSENENFFGLIMDQLADSTTP
jgi:hypothetical protein